MSEAAAIVGLLQSAKAAGDILSAMVGLGVSAKVSAKIAEANKHLIEVQTQILAVQRENAALVARIRELEEQHVSAKRQHSGLEDYEMKQVGPGTVVYAVKPGHDRGEPPHWLCPNCFSNGHKSMLQKDFIHTNLEDIFGCPRCERTLTVRRGVAP